MANVSGQKRCCYGSVYSVLVVWNTGIGAMERTLTNNLTSGQNTSAMYTERNVDSGAVWFSAAVVLVYGVAVIGVLVMSFIKHRNTNHQEVDEQATTFLKQIEQVRTEMEMSAKVMVVVERLEHLKHDRDFPDNRKTVSFQPQSPREQGTDGNNDVVTSDLVEEDNITCSRSIPWTPRVVSVDSSDDEVFYDTDATLYFY